MHGDPAPRSGSRPHCDSRAGSKFHAPGALDFSTLRKMPAEYVSDERLVRRGDTVWEVRLDAGRAVLVVVEFQSSEDPRMALRLLAYTALLYQELARNDAPGLDEAGRRCGPRASGRDR